MASEVVSEVVQTYSKSLCSEQLYYSNTLVLNDLKEKEKSTEKNFNCLMFTRLFGTNLCLKLKKLSSPLRVLASEAAEHNMNIYKVLVYEN